MMNDEERFHVAAGVAKALAERRITIYDQLVILNTATAMLLGLLPMCAGVANDAGDADIPRAARSQP